MQGVQDLKIACRAQVDVRHMDKRQRAKLVERALGTQDPVRKVFTSATALYNVGMEAFGACLYQPARLVTVLTMAVAMPGQFDIPAESQGPHGQVRMCAVLHTGDGACIDFSPKRKGRLTGATHLTGRK